MSGESETRSSRLERALQVYVGWKVRADRESTDELLGAHEELRDLLEPMVEEGEVTAAARAVDPAVDRAVDRAAEVADPAGRQLGDFRIVREVGRGGMGVVYEARQISLDRRVALKILPAHLGLQASAIVRFRREATTASRLSHPGLVEVYAVGREGELHYLAMEFVDGAPLDEVLKRLVDEDRSALSGARVGEAVWATLAARGSRATGVEGERFHGSYNQACVELALQVADALSHVHAANVMHRDVKPSNIIVRADGAAVLTDFGLAKEQGLPSVTMTGEFAGTPHYVAPEQAMAKRMPVDHRADVFSLGATLYELLTLRRAFDGETSQEVLGRVVTAEPVDPLRINPDLPVDLSAIVLKALEKDPDRRYASAGAMAEDLRAFLEYRPVSARRISRRERARRWVRRNPVVASLLAAIVVLLLGGATWTVFKNRELSTNVARLHRLSDGRTLARLQEQFDDIPAFAPEHAGAITAWLDEARPVVARRGLHERTLAELRDRALPYTDEDRQRDFESHPLALELQQLTAEGFPDDYLRKLEAEVRARRTWLLADDGDQWEHDALTDVVAALRSFMADGSDPGAGTGPWLEMQERLAFVRDVERRAIDAGSPAWRAAIEDIARPDSPYRGLLIEPQAGLVPIRADPTTGLQEFAHEQTGVAAVRGSNGEIAIDEATGIVFVLVPGGTFRMGARRPDGAGGESGESGESGAGGANVDPWANATEGPPHDVTLDPFFLSKYEMTQAQWSRFTGRLSGQHQAGMWFEGGYLTGLQPVEYVSALSCDRVLAAMGLELPTEAQWEYAARAGTTTVWWPGADGEDLEGVANLADRRFLDHTGVAADRFPSGWVFDDGYLAPAPVGGPRRPNAFGMYDVHGNVAEWTSTRPCDYTVPARPGDGQRDGGARWRIHRGGSYATPAGSLRSAARAQTLEDTVSDDLGLRPARRLHRSR